MTDAIIKTVSVNDICSQIQEAIRLEMKDDGGINEKHKVEDKDKGPLSHFDEFVEPPYTLIESYFQGQHLERLVRHQIESYNHFINYQIQRTIQMFNPVLIHSEHDYIEPHDKYLLEISISFHNFKLYPPQIYENNGATKTMYPQEAKLRSFTYASTMTIDIHIEYIVRNTDLMDTPTIIKKILPKINIGKMPIMLKSSICVLSQNRSIDPVLMGECPLDCGGYFIIKGSEKTVLGQERAAENRVYCFDGKNTTKWSWYAEIKSIPDFKCISPKQIEMMVATKNNGFGHAIYMNIPRVKQPIELFIVFRALGIMTDKAICEYVLLDVDDENSKEILNFLQASVIESKGCMTQEDAVRYITSAVAFTPLNMDKEKGAKKKREFTIDVLNNDLFPHCKTVPQKLYMLGYMCRRLIQTYLGWLPPDDRDSYVNKRIELTGTLLNNLFRNYFNKLVKEMQKQIVREIDKGSWRSMDNYESIINMTNIYKIMKSTTIENGINRALSTGDFSIKQSNSSKVGVAQVLSRLTYVSSLSHLRRINTPMEKSGELVSPRKLHNTTWGFLCSAETPEGQSIGFVKNISYMAHITIPSNSGCLYNYILPYILTVEDTPPKIMYGKVRVFINGAWVGVTDTPQELYLDIKDKKYRGIINIYTSVIFDYKTMEIRVCNDGGRLTRPVLRVKNNSVILTKDIVDQIDKRELTWNDLLISCRIPESVVEYIDPEEQGFAMIAMKSKERFIQPKDVSVNYTHCEIHPSMIFGVLASCIPFPEHNQSPRNTYQCLHPSEKIFMCDGQYIPIKDVKVGEEVWCFNPDTMMASKTIITGQFVQPIANDMMTYRIKTCSKRTVVATEDHRFITETGWKTVLQIKSDNLRIGLSMKNFNLSVDVESHILIETDMFRVLHWFMKNLHLVDPIGKTETLFKVVEYMRYTGFNDAVYMTVKAINDFNEWMKNVVCVKGDFMFVPVLSIEMEPTTHVSCIEVESNNHSFITFSRFGSANCCMAKQAIGVYALNYDQRMDKTAYVLTYPSKPLVETRLMNFIQLNSVPSGHQIHVAIMSHTGYNQEDSVLVNKASIDRGLFLTTVYHTEKDEDKNIIRDEIIRCKPDSLKTKGIKFGNYDKLNAEGFIPENTLVENRDVIIAKIVPIKENRNDPTKTIKYEDQSKIFRTTEECYIDKNYTGRNGDGYNFAKVRVRTLRKPTIGDKFSSRSGQKGTCGCIIPECDMPFTKDGLRPDIILNPHAIPSRMTIAQLKETILGKVLIEMGCFGDATSFGDLDIRTICKELQRIGYESYGNEIMYNGMTGEQMETSIFIGPVYYQRLKHMVADKQHSRSIGPMVNLTRQPAGMEHIYYYYVIILILIIF